MNVTTANNSTWISGGELPNDVATTPITVSSKKVDEPVVKVINQELMRNNNTMDSGNNYMPSMLIEQSLIKQVNEAAVADIYNSSVFNISDCYALKMLQIFANLAQSMESAANWQQQSIEMMDVLNTCTLELSKMLQEISSQLQVEHQQQLEDATRKGGLIGLLVNLLTLTIAISMCLPVPSPLGVVMLLNSIMQMVGNIGKMVDPAAALQPNSWQECMAKNGMFAIFDLAGEGAGQTAQTIGTVLMLLLGDVSSGVSAISSRALLTNKEVVCKALLIFDNILKVVGMVGSVCQTNDSNSTADETQRNIFAALSMGSIAGAANLGIHASGLDDGLAVQLTAALLGAGLGIATNTLLQKGSLNNLPPEHMSKIIKALPVINRTYNLSMQFNNLNAAVIRVESTIKTNNSKEYESDTDVSGRVYEFGQSQIGTATSVHSKHNEDLMKSQQEMMDLIKEIEQIFMQIFINSGRSTL